jgi:predicted CopG family antitoxin
VSSKTVSLETSAYERLKAAKTPDESFSEAVNRILSSTKPTFRQLAGFLTPSEAENVRTAIRRMRTDEAPNELKRIQEWRNASGRRTRH